MAKYQLQINRYTAIMKEIKVRVKTIETSLNGATFLHDRLVEEFCYLQLRMTCELIALGCLVAHGDIGGTTRMRTEWSAAAIMNGLEKLHPDFYPLPTSQSLDANGRMQMQDNTNIDYITKKQLVALNGRCGEFLHRGTSETLFTDSKPVDFDEIEKHAQRIFNLLCIHTMLLFDRNTILTCGLNTGDDESIHTWVATGM